MPMITIARPYRFPLLVANSPSLPHENEKQDVNTSGLFNIQRDFAQDLDDLSDEEADMEEILADIQKRGFAFLVPMGCTSTLQEQKVGEEEDSTTEEDSSESYTDDESGSYPESDGVPGPSVMDGEESEGVAMDDFELEEEDMDAELEDFDGEPYLRVPSFGNPDDFGL